MIEKNPNKNNLIKFNVSKNEIFQLSENYKTVHRKLKLQYSVELSVPIFSRYSSYKWKKFRQIRSLNFYNFALSQKS